MRSVHCHARHRDQHLSPLPTSLESYRESACSPARRASRPMRPRMCTAPLFVGRARAAAGGLRADRGQLLCRQPGRHDQPAPTTRPCATRSWTSSGGVAGRSVCCSACTAPWWRTATTTSKATSSSAPGAIVGPKCVIGVELDPHCHLTLKRVSGGRHHRALQGVPAHRRGRARRGRSRSRAGDPARQDRSR